MPNHVITEIVFRGVSKEKKAEILAMVSGANSQIDFTTLLPIPLNVWQGSVGRRHEEAFYKENTALDWSRQNWGTKWNAYGLDEGGRYHSIVQVDDRLVLTFQTAWRTPYGWLLALWHKSNVPLEYTWFDEGREHAVAGRFTTYDDDMRGDPWLEAEADEATTRRFHKLMFGVEAFEDEGDE